MSIGSRRSFKYDLCPYWAWVTAEKFVSMVDRQKNFLNIFIITWASHFKNIFSSRTYQKTYDGYTPASKTANGRWKGDPAQTLFERSSPLWLNYAGCCFRTLFDIWLKICWKNGSDLSAVHYIHLCVWKEPFCSIQFRIFLYLCWGPKQNRLHGYRCFRRWHRYRDCT